MERAGRGPAGGARQSTHQHLGDWEYASSPPRFKKKGHVERDAVRFNQLVAHQILDHRCLSVNRENKIMALLSKARVVAVRKAFGRTSLDVCRILLAAECSFVCQTNEQVLNHAQRAFSVTPNEPSAPPSSGVACAAVYWVLDNKGFLKLATFALASPQTLPRASLAASRFINESESVIWIARIDVRPLLLVAAAFSQGHPGNQCPGQTSPELRFASGAPRMMTKQQDADLTTPRWWAHELSIASTLRQRPPTTAGASTENYTGEWQTDKRSGLGVVRCVNGDVYIGEWAAGDRSGSGACAFGCGDLYEGTWAEDRMHGTGALLQISGQLFTGDFRAGRPHGAGRCHYVDGSVYEGEFSEGARHGAGRLLLPSGAVYVGEWEQDAQEGRGTMTSADGSVYSGKWRDGRRQGQGRLLVGGVQLYEGQWADDERCGYGEAAG